MNQTNTISRDASNKIKGFRLQKLRAAHLLLTSYLENQKSYIWVATELEADVRKSGEDSDYHEENKNYAEDSSFTFASKQIRKTIVAFLDNYIDHSSDNHLRFGFYSTGSIGHEISKGIIKELGLSPLDDGILIHLTAGNYEQEGLHEIVTAIVLEEYRRQYEKKGHMGHLSILQNWDKERWKKFFKRIDWRFEQEDEQELEKTVVSQIRQLPTFSTLHVGKEEIILNSMLGELDRMQSTENSLAKRFYVGNLAQILLDTASGVNLPGDPTGQNWNDIESTLEDTRTIGQKLSAVCNNISDRYLKALARKIAASLAEQEYQQNNPNLKSVKLQVYDCCYDYLLNHEQIRYSQGELKSAIEGMTDAAVIRIEERQKDYGGYPLTNRDSIHGMIVSFFDGCFLAFDENNKENGNDDE